jgi:hypothetical protein
MCLYTAKTKARSPLRTVMPFPSTYLPLRPPGGAHERDYSSDFNFVPVENGRAFYMLRITSWYFPPWGLKLRGRVNIQVSLKNDCHYLSRDRSRKLSSQPRITVPVRLLGGDKGKKRRLIVPSIQEDFKRIFIQDMDIYHDYIVGFTSRPLRSRENWALAEFSTFSSEEFPKSKMDADRGIEAPPPE